MTSLRIDETIYADLLDHLGAEPEEQVAFLYTMGEAAEDELDVAELHPVPPEGFVGQSAYHLALTDEVRAEVIGHAWDLGGAVIEAHTHPGAPRAGFSPTDLDGFEEWVPHVRWRLQGATYIALVFAGADFDALVWEGEGAEPGPLARLLVGEHELLPSNLTIGALRRRR
jgi:hypothetical protein